MILRRPFAILIKYFKLIHMVLTALCFYLLYRTNLLLSFFNEYLETYNSVIGKNLTEELYSAWMYISIVMVIISSIIILGLMLLKSKPVKLYIYNILTHIFVAVVYIYTSTVLSSLEIQLVDVRVLKVVQDLLTTAFIIQLISLIIVAMRATGFNVKKFEFSRDLKELEIDDFDSEEFEVNIDFNSDEKRRKINRTLRHMKYIYKENKFVLWLLLTIVVGISSFAIYMNVGVYNKVYQKGEAFSTTYFSMSLGESYSTNTNYRGKEILKEESFVIIHMNIRKNASIKKEFESARLVLKINEHNFYHQKIYAEQLFDMGDIYVEKDIPNQFTDYVFVYKVPSAFLNEKIRLVYTDYNSKNIRLNIEPNSLLENKEEKAYTVGETIDLKDSVLENIKFKIDSVLLENAFRIDYNYCLTTCYPSYEYIKPTLSGKLPKSLLKINGEILGENDNDNKNLYNLIKTMGYVEYEINGNKKTVSLNTKLVSPTKTKLQNEYYIEVPQEIKNAEKVNLVFKIRNKTYKYIIK